MTSGVYLITCLVTQELYVGRSHNIAGRWLQHVDLLQKQKHHSKRLQALWNTHGPTAFSFQILEVCSTEECYSKEIQWHKKLGATLTGNQKDVASRNQEISRNTRIFWEWVRSKGGRTVQDASMLSSNYRSEYLAYKESRLMEEKHSANLQTKGGGLN